MTSAATLALRGLALDLVATTAAAATTRRSAAASSTAELPCGHMKRLSGEDDAGPAPC